MRDDGDAPGIAALVVRFPSGHTQRLSVFFARTHTHSHSAYPSCAPGLLFLLLFSCFGFCFWSPSLRLVVLV